MATAIPTTGKRIRKPAAVESLDRPKDPAAAPGVPAKAAARPRRATKPTEPGACAAEVPRRAAVDAGERHHLIAVAAYYIAERRGFATDRAHDDWLTAEAEVDAMIAAGRFAD